MVRKASLRCDAASVDCPAAAAAGGCELCQAGITIVLMVESDGDHAWLDDDALSSALATAEEVGSCRELLSAFVSLHSTHTDDVLVGAWRELEQLVLAHPRSRLTWV
jgi:hypothetical protein